MLTVAATRGLGLLNGPGAVVGVPQALVLALEVEGGGARRRHPAGGGLEVVAMVNTVAAGFLDGEEMVQGKRRQLYDDVVAS